jgi:hypothetical protein
MTRRALCFRHGAHLLAPRRKSVRRGSAGCSAGRVAVYWSGTDQVSADPATLAVTERLLTVPCGRDRS